MENGKTTNKSFIDFYEKIIASNNNDVCLNGFLTNISTEKGALRNFDSTRYITDETIKQDSRLRILDSAEIEYLENIWFFFREYIRIPVSNFMNISSTCDFFINELSFAMIYLYLKRRSFVVMPKYTRTCAKGASTTFILLLIYSYIKNSTYTSFLAPQDVSDDIKDNVLFKEDSWYFKNLLSMNHFLQYKDIITKHASAPNSLAGSVFNDPLKYNGDKRYTHFYNYKYNAMRTDWTFNDAFMYENATVALPLLNKAYSRTDTPFIANLEINLDDFMTSSTNKFVDMAYKQDFLFIGDDVLTENILKDKDYLKHLPKNITIVIQY